MTFALGLELAAEAVRVATTTNGQVLDEPVEVVVPVLFIRPDGLVAVGGDALSLSATRPQGLITDVVGQFDVDRLFLTEGRMLSPDETLRELLAVVIAAVESRRQASAGAVTVACPVEWADAVRQRVERIVAGLGAARLHVMSGGDAARAAGDAFTRLPVAAPAEVTEPREELPALDPGFGRGAPPPPARRAEPERTRFRPQWVAVAVFLGLVGSLVAWLAVVAVRNDRGDASATTTTRVYFDLVPRSEAPPTPTTVPAPRASTIALVTSGTADPAVSSAVEAAGAVLGQPAGLLVAPVTSPADASAAVARYRAQQVAAVVLDVEPTALDPAVGAAGTGLAVCATSTPSLPPAGATVLVATAGRCAEVLLLAVLQADDADPLLVADALRQIGSDRGVACETFERCRRLVERGQPITYTPDGRPLRLRPPANSSR